MPFDVQVIISEFPWLQSTLIYGNIAISYYHIHYDNIIVRMESL